MAIAPASPAQAPVQPSTQSNSPIYSGANVVGYTNSGSPGKVQTAPQSSSNQPNTGAPQPPAVLNANISNPANLNQTVNPPSVITSSNASTDLQNKQTQTNQINQDAQNQAAAKATPPPAPQTNQSNQNTDNETQGSSDDIDTQINNLLGTLNTGQEALTQSENTQLTPIQQEQQETQTDLDNQASVALSKLNNIANGTYPLSPAESSLLASTVSVYNQTLAYQQQANAGYTGQMTEAMASLGINTSAPTEAIGMIHAAIDTGQSKITDIDAQMSQSVAQLTLGFQTQDYNMVSDAWTATSNYLQNRISTLQTMQTTISTLAQQQKTDLQNQVSDNLTALMDTNTISFQDKQQMIAQATLDEKTKDDLTKNLIAEYTAGMTGGVNGNSPLPTVNVDSTGKADPVAQASFLQQFPPQVASLIKGVANYTINPNSISTSKKQSLGGFTQSQILSLATQYDPSFDEKQYATRSAMQKNVTSGQYSQTITAANTLIQHLAKLQTDFAAVGNGNFGVLNAGKNAMQELGGSGKQTAVATDISAVASEAAKIYKGTGSATDQEITDWQKSISPNASPAQMQAAISSITDLMGGKLSTLSDNYSQVMGQPAGFQILTDASAATLKKLGIDPTTVDPTYANSPSVKLQDFYTSDSKNASLIDQLIQADPSLQSDPQAMIDTLNQNGINLQ